MIFDWFHTETLGGNHERQREEAILEAQRRAEERNEMIATSAEKLLSYRFKGSNNYFLYGRFSKTKGHP